MFQVSRLLSHFLSNLGSGRPVVWTNDDFAFTRDAAHPDALPPIGFAPPAAPTRVQPSRTNAKNTAMAANIKEVEARIGLANSHIQYLQKEYQAVRERSRHSSSQQQLQTSLSRMRQIEREIAACREQIHELEIKLAALRGPDSSR